MLRRPLAALAAALVGIVIPVTAHATAPTEPAPTEAAPAETPPATEAPSTPDPTTPATEAPGGDDGDDSGIGVLAIVLIIAGVVALIALLGALLGRGRRPAPPPATPTPRGPTTPSPQANLLTTAQWIHDQLSLELMAAPPANAQQRWATERSRLDNVAIGAQQQFAAGNHPSWESFGRAMSSLAVALDTNLQLRAQEPPNQQLITESTAVVNRDRATVQQLIDILRPTVTS